MNRKRRLLLMGSACALTALAQPSLSALLDPTPRQTRGPFYPRKPPLDSDNDLIHVGGREERADGIFTEVTGRIVDPAGEPVDSARVEIWQCDANGRYHHPRASADGRDPHFQGFGTFTTDTDGRYRFRTIRALSRPYTAYPLPWPPKCRNWSRRCISPDTR